MIVNEETIRYILQFFFDSDKNASWTHEKRAVYDQLNRNPQHMDSSRVFVREIAM